MSCSGRGECFEQGDDGRYNESHRHLICDKGCTLIRCPNFEYCGEILPEQFLDCFHGRCFSCDLNFGKNLTFADDIDCTVCLETTRGVKRVNCDHYSCIKCFQESHKSQTYFPVPEYTYSDDEDHSEDDPLIVEYHIKLDEWEDREAEEYEKRKYLRTGLHIKKTFINKKYL